MANIETPKTHGSAHRGALSSCSATDAAICWNSIFSPRNKKDDDGGNSRRSGLLYYVTAMSGADLALALDNPLRGCQLGQAHRAAGVQLLRGDADLGTQAQLAAVGKARGR